jgi:hypothetical protein
VTHDHLDRAGNRSGLAELHHVVRPDSSIGSDHMREYARPLSAGGEPLVLVEPVRSKNRNALESLGYQKQMARNVTMEGCGILRDCRYLLHDRDTKFTQSFRAIIASGQVEPLALPAQSPNLNAYAERWVRSVKEEILCRCSGRGDTGSV